MKRINLNMKKSIIILLFIILVGAFLRFYNLDWGNGYFFHPDERNIIFAALNIDFLKGDLNPNFFAYGAFPIYILRLLGGSEFESIAITGRLVSAFLSTLSIPMMYIITKEILKKDIENRELWALATAFLMTFSPGLIQFAHFLTFETFLYFQYILFLLFSIRIYKHEKLIDYIMIAFVIATSISTKIISIYLIPIYFICHILTTYKSTKEIKIHIRFFRNLLNNKFILSLCFLVLTTFVFSAYNFLDYINFKNSMDYETNVATGNLLVFYTQQFLETTPFIYQITRIFPYILGVPLILLGFFAIIYLCIKSFNNFRKILIEKKFSVDFGILILLLIIFGYGTFHMWMWVKWTRYMIPLLPFLILSITIALAYIFSYFDKKYRRSRILNFSKILMFILLFVPSTIQGVNFFSYYLEPDSRVVSAQWAKNNLPEDSKILTENYDIGITAWHRYFTYEQIEEFDFYELDNDTTNQQEETLKRLLDETNYIVIASDRVFPTRFRLAEKYPKSKQFYTELFDGSLGYKLIQGFSRKTIFEKISKPDPSFNHYLSTNNFTRYDETLKVFDRPTVLIFEKIIQETTSGTYLEDIDYEK